MIVDQSQSPRIKREIPEYLQIKPTQMAPLHLPLGAVLELVAFRINVREISPAF